MIGKLSSTTDPRAAARAAFVTALTTFDRARAIIVLGHFDADGLSAIAILARALRAAGWQAEPRVTGKGESPWDEGFAATLGTPAQDLGGLIVADLGTRPEPVLAGVPTIVIDHHLPTGTPADATTISGNGLTPEPTTALLAWWACAALGDQADLLWLAALGLIGDMADEAGFPELAQAQARWARPRCATRPAWSTPRALPPPATPARRCGCCWRATAPRRSPRSRAPIATRWSPPRPRCARRSTPRAASRPRCAATSR